MFGPKREADGSCRILKNAEVEELNADPNIKRETKAHRLRWPSRDVRMVSDRIAKRAYLGQPHAHAIAGGM